MPGDQSCAVVRRRPRLEQPLLPLVEDGQRAPERRARGLSERRDSARQLPRAAHGEARGRVAKLAPEVRIVVHLRLANGETRGRALLAVVAEGRSNEVADRLVPIRERGDDDGVLPARFREQGEIGSPAEKQASRFHRAGQDDGSDAGIGHQRLAGLVVGAGQKLEDLTRDAGIPQTARPATSRRAPPRAPA